jgi:copper(I)-binding protein
LPIDLHVMPWPTQSDIQAEYEQGRDHCLSNVFQEFSKMENQLFVFRAALACAALMLLGFTAYSPSAQASSFSVAGIEVQAPEAMATSAGQPNSAIFIKAISNKAAQADRLVLARSSASASIEFHNMTINGGVMRMREIPGIDLPAGSKVLMHRGSKEGYHLMLMGLKKPLEVGQVIPVTLVFEKAGELEVKASVVDMRARGHGGHHGGAGMYKH